MTKSHFRQTLAGGGTARATLAALGFAALIGATAARADEATTIQLTVKDHKFDPAEPSAPAGKPLTIELSNLDATPIELESKPLRVEKTVAGGGKIRVQVRALSPGRYRFFDDYNESTTEGFLVVR